MSDRWRVILSEWNFHFSPPKVGARSEGLPRQTGVSELSSNVWRHELDRGLFNWPLFQNWKVVDKFWLDFWNQRPKFYNRSEQNLSLRSILKNHLINYSIFLLWTDLSVGLRDVWSVFMYVCLCVCSCVCQGQSDSLHAQKIYICVLYVPPSER